MVPFFSPINLLFSKVLCNELLVVWFELRQVEWSVFFGVQVIIAESFEQREHPLVLIVKEVVVSVFSVKSIERVVTDQEQCLRRQVFLDYVVEVLVMAPSHVNIIKPTIWIVNSGFSHQPAHFAVTVNCKVIMENYFIGKVASNS